MFYDKGIIQFDRNLVNFTVMNTMAFKRMTFHIICSFHFAAWSISYFFEH